MRASVPRWTRGRAGLVAAVAAFALLGWQGISTVSLDGLIDSGEHRSYAIYIDAHHSTPSSTENYEYETPPLFHVAAIALEHTVRRAPSRALETPWNPLTRGLWLALAFGGIAAMTSARKRVRAAGLGAMALAVLWGIDEAISLGKTHPWSAGAFISFAACVGLVLVTRLIALEAWPGHPRRALAAAGFVLAYPVVLRMGVFFHPEMPLAFLVALATLIFLRAARLGWPHRLAWALGAACGAAALTRQTAVVVMACVAFAGVAAGGRRALGFLARAAVVTALLVTPWWVYAYKTWGNPLQGNLDWHASLIMPAQPTSFYISFPVGSLVLHPYRPDFDNELLPKLHAELWSDWVGGFHVWYASSVVDRVTASSQSVLGLVADGLAIGGLFAIAVPAGLRVLFRRRPRVSDLPLGFLGLLALAAFSGFVFELVRHPQRFGDPIKSSYLLFTAPCWAIFSVAAWTAVVRGRARIGALLAAVAVLYVMSYSLDLGAAFAHRWTEAPPPDAVDLRASIAPSVTEALVDQEVDYTVGIANVGGQTGNGMTLTISLPAGMRLVGPPSLERGSGCTGTRIVRCDLGFLADGQATIVRFGAKSSLVGVKTVAAAATTSDTDFNPSDNSASVSVAIVPGNQARVHG